jgi:hypothetical protein
MINYIINESAVSALPSISKKHKDTVEFIAIMQEADRPNRNGRIYFKKVLEEALNSPYVQERLRTKSFYVEAGHPTDTSVQRQMTIDQRNIAAIVNEFFWEGNLLKARLETANTAVGRDMKGLIEQGSRVAFSLRAQGNVHRDEQLGATVVESPIQIASYDWVVNPSHDKAFLESICEATMGCLFNRGTNEMALVEAARLFDEGSLISLSESVTTKKVIDYAKTYGQKLKPVSETYFYDPKDTLRVDGKFAILENADVQKKVILEEYLLKEIRSRIVNLGESKVENNNGLDTEEAKYILEAFIASSELNKDEKNFLNESETLNEGMMENIRWKLLKFSLGFLKEDYLNKVLSEYYSDKDGKPTEKEREILRMKKGEKVKILKGLVDRISQEEKDKILKSSKVKSLDKLAKSSGAAAIIGGTSAIVGSASYKNIDSDNSKALNKYGQDYKQTIKDVKQQSVELAGSAFEKLENIKIEYGEKYLDAPMSKQFQTSAEWLREMPTALSVNRIDVRIADLKNNIIELQPKIPGRELEAVDQIALDNLKKELVQMNSLKADVIDYNKAMEKTIAAIDGKSDVINSVPNPSLTSTAVPEGAILAGIGLLIAAIIGVTAAGLTLARQVKLDRQSLLANLKGVSPKGGEK